jgi:hypothetical protein
MKKRRKYLYQDHKGTKIIGNKEDKNIYKSKGEEKRLKRENLYEPLP